MHGSNESGPDDSDADGDHSVVEKRRPGNEVCNSVLPSFVMPVPMRDRNLRFFSDLIGSRSALLIRMPSMYRSESLGKLASAPSPAELTLVSERPSLRKPVSPRNSRRPAFVTSVPSS